jgi:bacterioferritin (cytochrome b1)
MSEKSVSPIKAELAKMMNQALKLEHAAYIQYLAHAEKINGLYSEAVTARLKEIASDEMKHAEQFRNMIGTYLQAEVTMDTALTHQAKDLEKILEINLQDEKAAIDFYKKIYSKVIQHKAELQYEFETLEHELRHIIIDEQEHLVELTQLLDK